MNNVSSLDGNVVAELSVANSEIFYNVSKKGKEIIANSRLGISLKDISGTIKWNAVSVKNETSKSTWKRVWGPSSADVIDEYNESIFSFSSETIDMDIHLRCYNDCVAIRYVFNEQDKCDYINIVDELTEFNLTGNYPFWYSDDDGRHAEFMKDGGILLNNIKEAKSPITIKQASDCYVCIHEADLYKYDAPVFVKSEKENSIAIKTKSISMLPHKSPWRVILICDNLNELVTSNSIENLNPPCAIEDTSWIKTGKSMWDWRNHGAVYEDFTYDMNTESMKRYIDFASQNNIQYALIDGNWHLFARDIHKVEPLVCSPGVDIEEICRYGTEKGVRIWLYINDEAFVYLDIDMILATYAKWGAAGIKHGFMETRGQRRSVDTAKIAAKCAEYKLLYNPHEPERPWGLHRTYPNMICTEFINALYDGPNRPESTPSLLTINPFTNCLTAPVDRACGMFDMDSELTRSKCKRKAMSTTGSQVAQCITLFTGFLGLSDNPNAYTNKSDMFEFIKEMPPMTWDETKLLDGEIGQHVTLARRSGEAWFIGSQTNEEAREIKVSAYFLSDGEYTMTIYGDDENSHYINNREAYKVTTSKISKNDTITLKLAPGGGAGVWIRK